MILRVRVGSCAVPRLPVQPTKVQKYALAQAVVAAWPGICGDERFPLGIVEAVNLTQPFVRFWVVLS